MKRYFFDLDNTLCHTTNSNYTESQPIQERIEWVRTLKAQGHHITIWTARGQTSGIDHKDLTEAQLQEWDIHYDQLLMGKPHYDVYYDDKSFHVDEALPLSPPHTKKLPVEIVPKGWGKEIIFVNNDEYCGKILCFDAGKKFSLHYHVQKKETWYVAQGRFLLYWIDTERGVPYRELLEVGDVITNERGEPHQLEALEEGKIFEVSTRHYDADSFRVKKGD